MNLDLDSITFYQLINQEHPNKYLGMKEREMKDIDIDMDDMDYMDMDMDDMDYMDMDDMDYMDVDDIDIDMEDMEDIDIDMDDMDNMDMDIDMNDMDMDDMDTDMDMEGGSYLGDGLLFINDFSPYQQQIQEAIDQGIANEITDIKFNETSMPITTPIFAYLFDVFPNLSGITFWGSQNMDFTGLPQNYIDRIHRVDVYSGNFPIEALDIISKSRNLESFSHAFNLGVGDIQGNMDVISLRNHRNLRDLYLNGNYTSKIFDILSTISNLQNINVDSPIPDGFTQEDVKNFYDFYRNSYNPNVEITVNSRGQIFDFP